MIGRYSLVPLLLLLLSASAPAAGMPPLSEEQAEQAAAMYQQYCALCHGENREGHVNDHAPSLRSKSLMASGFPYALMYATGYGRHGTPMAPFLDEVGGPLTGAEIQTLVMWLRKQVDVEPVEVSLDMVTGDADLGASIYQRECAECHGAQGEGGTGTALGNQTMLLFTPDEFLQYAIVHGRDGTDMQPFADKLSDHEIDSVVAFLRSRATGWTSEKPVYRSPPPADQYVQNPDGEDPDFDLKDGIYVMSADLDAAMRAGQRMVLLDTRNIAMWQMANIEGSVPLPYYYRGRDIDGLVADLPKDGTTIVTYCECPRAAAESVSKVLASRGFENTAVLWEGIQGWIALGYPVVLGETEAVEAPPLADP